MKLEKHLGLGRDTIGSNDEKNKKQGHSPSFEKIWNILKIIVWIICVYIIIRSFLFSGEGQPPSQNSKILGEKSVIINNIPQSALSIPAIVNSMQRNDSKEFETLLKLTQSLKMLMASLKLGETEETYEHPEPPKAKKLQKNLVEKLSDRELKKADETTHKNNTLDKETSQQVTDRPFAKGKTTESVLLQSKVPENQERNTSSEIRDSLGESFSTKTTIPFVDLTTRKDDTNVSTSTTDAHTTESIISSSTPFFYSSSSTSNFRKREEEGKEQSHITTEEQDVTAEVVGFHNNNDAAADNADDDEEKKSSKEAQQHELRKVDMPGFLNFLSTPTTTPTTAGDVFYKNQSENSTLIDYSDNSRGDGSQNLLN